MKKRINPIAELAPLFSFDAPFRWPGTSRLRTMLRPRTNPFHTVILTKCVLPVCSSCGNYSPQGGNRDAPRPVFRRCGKIRGVLRKGLLLRKASRDMRRIRLPEPYRGPDPLETQLLQR